MDDLGARRTRRWWQTGRPIRSIGWAGAFVEDVGFALLFPTAGMALPSLYETACEQPVFERPGSPPENGGGTSPQILPSTATDLAFLMGLPRSSTPRSSLQEWPVQISHGGSHGAAAQPPGGLSTSQFGHPRPAHPGSQDGAGLSGRRAAHEGDLQAERQRRGGRDCSEGRDGCAQDRAHGDQQQPPVPATQQPPERPLGCRQ